MAADFSGFMIDDAVPGTAFSNNTGKDSDLGGFIDIVYSLPVNEREACFFKWNSDFIFDDLYFYFMQFCYPARLFIRQFLHFAIV
jgi:hypothetical protein